jgi:uncharacterized membrane protein
MWHHGMYGGGFGFGLMFLHLLGNLFFLALLIGAVLFFVRGARFAGRGPGNWGGWSKSMRGNPWMNNFVRDGALEVARTRLAKSEITPEQYEELRKGLEAREARAHEAERNEGGFSWRTDNALETARMRFATGEITHEQFEMIRSALER